MYTIKQIVDGIKSDPANKEFWQALGKALKWEKKVRMDYPSFIDDMPAFTDDLFYDENDWTRPTWLYHALRYIEILLTQDLRSAEKYLSSLITSRPNQ